jgi:thiamine kinase-like enzyme
VSAAQSPERVLAGIGGWEGATISELDGGLTNRTWLVEQDHRKAVLKIDASPRGAPYNSRLVEAGIQSIAAGHGLANAVLYADELTLLTEDVDGVVWEGACLELDDNIELVARTLRRLHSMPLSGRSFDSIVAAKRYVAKIHNADAALVEHCTRVIATMRLPHNLCCCHNDLVAGNIITTPGMKFLDWEYACDNDPFFDLATIVEHHELSEDVSTRLLDAYFGGDGQRWSSHLREQRNLYLALYWLWLASHPGGSQEELDNIAARIRAR